MNPLTQDAGCAWSLWCRHHWSRMFWTHARQTLTHRRTGKSCRKFSWTPPRLTGQSEVSIMVSQSEATNYLAIGAVLEEAFVPLLDLCVRELCVGLEIIKNLWLESALSLAHGCLTDDWRALKSKWVTISGFLSLSRCHDVMLQVWMTAPVCWWWVVMTEWQLVTVSRPAVWAGQW